MKRVLTCAAVASLALPASLNTPAASAPTGAQFRAAASGDQLRLDLHYDGKLLLKVFDMQVEQTATATSHASSARFQSYGVLAAFKKFDMRVSSSGRIVNGDPRPGQFTSKNYGSKSKRQVDVAWGRDDVTVAANPAYASLGEPGCDAGRRSSPPPIR